MSIKERASALVNELAREVYEMHLVTFESGETEKEGHPYPRITRVAFKVLQETVHHCKHHSFRKQVYILDSIVKKLIS